MTAQAADTPSGSLMAWRAQEGSLGTFLKPFLRHRGSSTRGSEPVGPTLNPSTQLGQCGLPSNTPAGEMCQQLAHLPRVLEAQPRPCQEAPSPTDIIEEPGSSSPAVAAACVAPGVNRPYALA